MASKASCSEIERLLRDTLGASRVVVFDHNVRNGGRADLAQPSRRVHSDHTVSSAPRRVRATWATMQRHCSSIGSGSSTSGGRSVGPCSILRLLSAMSVVSYRERPRLRPCSRETSSVEYKLGHRWYYFSEQQTDQVLLIRVHDSANDGRARLSFHTSFENPLALPDAAPRESIEVWALVFFPPEA